MIAVFTLAAFAIGLFKGLNSAAYQLAMGLFAVCLAIQTFYLQVWPVNSDEPEQWDYWLIAAVILLVWLAAVWLGAVAGRALNGRKRRKGG
jgi:hypothetical protein